MKCSNCGGGRMASHNQSYLYSAETGLPVTLAGVEVLSCPDCGESAPVIPRPLELARAIVGALARKQGRLVGAEVTFLRKMLDRNGRELSALMGCTPQAVSKWEQSASPIGVQADKLLRLAAAVHNQLVPADYSLSDLQNAATDEETNAPLRFTLTHEPRGGWRIVGESRKVA